MSLEDTAQGTATLEPEGLTSAEASRRLRESGPNAVADEVRSHWRAYLSKFWGPIPWLLEAALILQLALGERLAATVVGALLVFNATLGVLQEGRATAAVAALKKRLAPTALVRRDGGWTKLSAADLVPGDVVRLSLGALVPADVRVAFGSVMVDQSTVTGESMPIEAATDAVVYAGSLVRRGQAVAEVTATGARTYLGRAIELVRVAHSASTEQQAIVGTTRSLAVVNGALAVAVILYAYTLGFANAELFRLALTALLAFIPVALPATFTLSAAISANALSRRGVLLTRLSAAHESAGVDILCSDKTGTLTRNEMEVNDVIAMPGSDRGRVLALAALASSTADQDPIDAAIRRSVGAGAATVGVERLLRFVPFDPTTKMAEAFVADQAGAELRIVKGAFEAITDIANVPGAARDFEHKLSTAGNRVIAVAAGPSASLRLIGLIALTDSPRQDSAQLVSTLRDMGVRTVMVTGDSRETAAAVAGAVGITGGVCPSDRLGASDVSEHGVFARVTPEQKYLLVKGLQQRGHVVGMCGDGANDAPALRQAQIGIAVSSATDAAKAAAALVLTEPGLAGIVQAIEEGRIAFQRLLTYTLNMLVKRIEVVLLLAVGLAMTGRALLTPVLMVLLMITNDFLSTSLTTDRASPAPGPRSWHMRRFTAAAVVFAVCKLGFSTSVLAVGRSGLGLPAGQMQTLTFVTLVFGNQALLYVVRERRRLWHSRPSNWVMASSLVDGALVALLASSGLLMEPLPWPTVATVALAAVGLALVLDHVKLPVMALLKIE